MKLKLVRLGVFVAISSVLTVFIGQSITGGTPGARYELVATFDDVAGMYSGDDVKLAGITVGAVKAIDVVEGKARVTFAVDEEVRLPVDSTVQVRWRNLIGQRFLGLTPGSSKDLLADGDVMENARRVVDLGQLVNQLIPLARAVSPDQVNVILTTLLEAFEGNDESFDALVADMDSVLATLAARDDTISQLLADYDDITGALASRDAQIGQMIDNLVAISETFAENDDLLDRALVELAGFSTGLDGLLDASATELGQTIDHLGTLTGLAADNVDHLEAALRGLPAIFDSLLSTVNRGEWLRVSVLCLTVTPGQCPYPTSVSGGPGGDPIVFDPGSLLGDLLDELGLGGGNP